MQLQQARRKTGRFQTRIVPKREHFSPSPCTFQTCPLSWMKMVTWASLTCQSWTSCLRAFNTSYPSSHHLSCPVSSLFSFFCCLPLSLYPMHLRCLSHWHCAFAIWNPRRHHLPPHSPTAFRTVRMTRCVAVQTDMTSFHFDLCITRLHPLSSHNFSCTRPACESRVACWAIVNDQATYSLSGAENRCTFWNLFRLFSLYKYSVWQFMRTNTYKKPMTEFLEPEKQCALICIAIFLSFPELQYVSLLHISP